MRHNIHGCHASMAVFGLQLRFHAAQYMNRFANNNEPTRRNEASFVAVDLLVKNISAHICQCRLLFFEIYLCDLVRSRLSRIKHSPFFTRKRSLKSQKSSLQTNQPSSPAHGNSMLIKTQFFSRLKLTRSHIEPNTMFVGGGSPSLKNEGEPASASQFKKNNGFNR